MQSVRRARCPSEPHIACAGAGTGSRELPHLCALTVPIIGWLCGKTLRLFVWGGGTATRPENPIRAAEDARNEIEQQSHGRFRLRPEQIVGRGNIEICLMML